MRPKETDISSEELDLLIYGNHYELIQSDADGNIFAPKRINPNYIEVKCDVSGVLYYELRKLENSNAA